MSFTDAHAPRHPVKQARPTANARLTGRFASCRLGSDSQGAALTTLVTTEFVPVNVAKRVAFSVVVRQVDTPYIGAHQRELGVGKRFFARRTVEPLVYGHAGLIHPRYRRICKAAVESTTLPRARRRNTDRSAISPELGPEERYHVRGVLGTVSVPIVGRPRISEVVRPHT